VPEPIVQASHYIEIHLLYASIVWLAAWALTSIRLGSATTKYWIWVATSLNFALPLSVMFEGLRKSRPSTTAPLNATAIAILGAVWLLGTLVMLTRLCLRIRADRRLQGDSDPRAGFVAHGVPVAFEGNRQAPAVDGILRPRISLPDGIGGLLSEHELNAVLIHEVTHAKRGDNLIRLVHEVGLCALWFHPLVWITGSRLALYRELSCDESVIRRAHGEDLVSALAKLAGADDAVLLQATASSFISDRLDRLTATHTQRSQLVSNALLIAVFAAALLGSVLATAAQTAGNSPFVLRAIAPCPADRHEGRS
jgi:beta-lactamase regulating signal transducer with metallopeptidase domain